MIPDNELVLTRMFAASRARVWAAWATEDVDGWWGPDGFVTVTEARDVRPGGEWRFVMRHPTYGAFTNRVRYLEVVAPERLVYDHDAGEGDPDGFRVFVTFEDVEGQTRLTMRTVLQSAEACAQKKAFGAVEMGGQTLARLAAALAQGATGA